MNEKLTQNAAVLEKEFQWLTAVIETRLRIFFNSESTYETISEIPVPDLKDSSAPYARLVEHLNLGANERLTLLLAIAPQLRPEALDLFFSKNTVYNRPFTIFGGAPSGSFPGFLPTFQTAIFLLAGQKMESRLSVQNLFVAKHTFAQNNILEFENLEKGAPPLSAKLILSREYLELLSTGQKLKPGFSNEFPAQIISSKMEWEEVVLPNRTLEELLEIQDWLDFGEQLRQEYGLGRKIKPGYKCLFTGPPGTGKTLTACLLGKTTGKDVYRIDLSMIVSKYIGETEKNLAKVFDQAENQNWILFFDEADALFGKRGDTQSANDRFANQEVAYLLQRVEDYNGLVILASNFRDNIDSAFTRRFHSIIDFPLPDRKERLKLWQQSFSPKALPDPKIDLIRIADRYEVTGAQIMNIVHYCTLRSIKRGDQIINEQDLSKGMRKELAKEGITLI